MEKVAGLKNLHAVKELHYYYHVTFAPLLPADFQAERNKLIGIFF